MPTDFDSNRGRAAAPILFPSKPIHTIEFEPSENLSHTFSWDGLDWRGNAVDHPVKAYINIAYVYQGYYGNSYDNFIKWFAKYGQSYTGLITRAQLSKIQNFIIEVAPLVYAPNVATHMADGWTISNHHYLSSTDPAVLKKGNGAKVSSFDSRFIFNRIDTAAIIEPVTVISGSNSTQGTEQGLNCPIDIAMDAQGSIYIADAYNYQIKKIDRQGALTIIAGNGEAGTGQFSDLSMEKVAATNIPLDTLLALCVDNSGNVYFLDQYMIPDAGQFSGSGAILRKIDKTGMLSNVAKTALYSGPITMDDNGNLYIVDTANNRVLMLDTAGDITTIAGRDTEGSSMDMQLNYPNGITIDREGAVYIADSSNHMIRKIDTDGFIHTIAGTGERGYSGDDGPATSATLNYPARIQVDNAGNIYFIDTSNHCLRKINTNGIIKTITGQGATLYAGDGLPYEPELLTGYTDLEINDRGEIFILFGNKNLLTKLGPLTPYFYLENAGSNIYTEENGIGYAIDDAGHHLKTIDLETGVTLKTFNYSGTTIQKLETIVDQFGSAVTIERDSDQIPVAVISSDGLRTELTVDENNHLTRINFPDDSYYTFEYSPGGRMTLETDPNGNRFTHIFTESGRLSDILDENNGQWTYDRALIQDTVLTSVTTAEGNQKTYSDTTDDVGIYTSVITDETGGQTIYTESGMAASKTTACGMTLDFGYGMDSKYKYKYLEKFTETTPSGLQRITSTNRTYSEPAATSSNYIITLKTITNSKPYTLENDVLESRKYLTTPEGRSVTTLYNPDTLRPETIQVPGLFNTNFEYNGQGRLTSAATGNRISQYRYNNNGFLETFVDPQGNDTLFVHDPMGRVIQIQRPDNSSLYFDYDAAGNLTALTTPRQVDHNFEYNKVNLKSGYITPLSGSYTFEFDKDRRPTTTTLPSGRQITNIYGNGNLTQTQTPEGNIDYTYCCGNRIKSMTKGSQVLDWQYDGQLVTSVAYTGTLNQLISFSYNADFLPVAHTYAGASQYIDYDQDGLLTNAGNFTITRNEDNGLPEFVSDNSLSLVRTFNGYGETEIETFTVSGQTLVSWELERNDNAKIFTKTESLNGSTSNYNYTYDSSGRLLTVTRDNTLVEKYQYDKNGARSYEINTSRGISGRTFTYSDEDHLLTVGDVSYTYDADGFLTSKIVGADRTTYTYSSRGELLSVSLPDGNVIEYIHDPSGRRIAKKMNGTITEKYLWNDLTRLLAVYDDSNDLIMRFEYADGRMPLAVKKDGVKYYLGYNQVGSLVLVSDESGNPVKIVDYDTFGNILNDSNPNFSIPLGFAGGLYDTDTGLVRFGYRDYDPEAGRWTAKDPIGFAGGNTDLYGYVLNDPVNFVDPQGKVGIPGVIIGTVLGATSGFMAGVASGNGVVGFWAGIAGSLAGGIAGGAVGFFAPNASAMVGGVIGGVTGGAVAGGVNVKLSKGPCATFADYANGTVFGGTVGALMGTLGGGLIGLSGTSGAAIETAATMVTMPINLGIDITISTLIKN